MMNDMMGSGMTWGMGAVGLLVVVIVPLIIAALINISSFDEAGGPG